MKNTYIFIPGGESFRTQKEYQEFLKTTLVDWNLEPFQTKEIEKKWKIQLAEKLTKAGNLVYFPSFPNPLNAKYEEWKIFFENWIGKIEIRGKITVIGHSLGGCFLLNYFSEEKKNSSLQIHIKEIHLIASCISAGDFSAPRNYDFLKTLGQNVYIWHAEDDLVVPFSTGEDLWELLPNATKNFFSKEKGYGHFHKKDQFIELEKILLENK